MQTAYLTGKVPPKALTSLVFKYLGVKNRRLILGPGIGEDAAVIEFGKKTIVVTTDPITGATEKVGWLSVHVNSNDVAVRGAIPRWYLCSILLPEKKNQNMLKSIMSEIDKAARELNVTVVGGHSEVTQGLKRPLVIGFMIGEIDKGKHLTSHGARLGDFILLTKQAGIEGTAILATDLNDILRNKISKRLLSRARKLIRRISIVKESEIATSSGGVTAMHDPTEGGVVNGVWELAEASKCGCVVNVSQVPVMPETEAICNFLKIDPLEIMSSGALLMTVRPKKIKAIMSRLKRAKIHCACIGRITESKNGRIIIKKNGKMERLVPPKRDPLYLALERFVTE